MVVARLQRRGTFLAPDIKDVLSRLDRQLSPADTQLDNDTARSGSHSHLRRKLSNVPTVVLTNT